LGFDEFKLNMGRIGEGVNRGITNQELREMKEKRDKNDDFKNNGM